MTTKQKPVVDWIGMGVGGDSMICRRCGRSYPMSMPASIRMVTAMMAAFEGDHADCADNGPLPSTGDRLADWLKSGDTGASSETIATVMSGRIIGDRRYAPSDPSDFGRCHRLLTIFPEWRPRMSEVAAIFPEWRPLVREWDRLTALYERDLPTGKSDELYRLIRQLRGNR